jgi:trans-2,3-dihydro-3-hydroxyanthranilate isomerase
VPSFRYVVADVFTDTPLSGNQLAVFTDAREIPEEQLQPLAREMAFSETVFVYPPEQDGHVHIRIFTPAHEMPFAGHPVLGTAFVLAGPMQLAEIGIETGAGIVPVLLEREGARLVFGRMNQPVPTVEAFPAAERLLGILGVERSELPVDIYDNGMPHVFVALASESTVARLAPDPGLLESFQREEMSTIGGVNCFAGVGLHWKTRMFSPADGVLEDPATGSAAGPLACHLARHGLIAFGDEIEISQGTELHRPSKLFARVEGSSQRIDRVEVGGSAVVVARGEFRL